MGVFWTNLANELGHHLVGLFQNLPCRCKVLWLFADESHSFAVPEFQHTTEQLQEAAMVVRAHHWFVSASRRQGQYESIWYIWLAGHFEALFSTFWSFHVNLFLNPLYYASLLSVILHIYKHIYPNPLSIIKLSLSIFIQLFFSIFIQLYLFLSIFIQLEILWIFNMFNFLLVSTMWGPLVISWFISPNNYSYKYHKP